MKELIIAFGLFLFFEGILYAIFPSKMKSMLKKLELIKDSQLRTGGLVFAIIGFIIIYLNPNFESCLNLLFEKRKNIIVFSCLSILITVFSFALNTS